MSKPQTSTPESRWNKRSLKQQLIYKFLNEYGYEHGPVVASAIVEDILTTINQVYTDHLPPRHVIWPAVSVRNGSYTKSPDIHELVPVRLQMVTDEEVALLNDRQLLKEQRSRRRFNQLRYARWCQEAYQQDGVLSLLDLSLLSGYSEKHISTLVREYEKESDIVVPTRGTVHDLGPSVTHKAEVVRRYLRGQSPADIAHELHHTQHSVDRYIQDYEVTRQLVQRFPISQIPAISRLSPSLIQQHVELIRTYEPQLTFFDELEAPESGDPHT
jgi:hypothetical protein